MTASLIEAMAEDWVARAVITVIPHGLRSEHGTATQELAQEIKEHGLWRPKR